MLIVQYRRQGIAFLPLVAETFGGWHTGAQREVKKLAAATARHTWQEEAEARAAEEEAAAKQTALEDAKAAGDAAVIAKAEEEAREAEANAERERREAEGRNQPNFVLGCVFNKKQIQFPQRFCPPAPPPPSSQNMVLSLSQNAAIAREALELLVTCLKLRPHLLNMFYTLTHIEDFIIDILLGSPHVQIRLSVVEQLILLCSVNTGMRVM